MAGWTAGHSWGEPSALRGVLILNTHAQFSPEVLEAVNVGESPRTHFSESWEVGKLESLRQL